MCRPWLVTVVARLLEQVSFDQVQIVYMLVVHFTMVRLRRLDLAIGLWFEASLDSCT